MSLKASLKFMAVAFILVELVKFLNLLEHPEYGGAVVIRPLTF
jgi:hypothetical protein